MKYVPLPKFEMLEAALDFHRDGLHIKGGCDIYITKQTKEDKRLLQRIDAQVEEIHQLNLQLAASFSPKEAKRYQIAPHLDKTTGTAFGDLNVAANRRVYRDMIAGLNDVHQEYDLSNVLRASDFRKVHDLAAVMREFDAKVLGQDIAHGRNWVVTTPMSNKWGYDKWVTIDDEMDLGRCDIYHFCPIDYPFDDEGPPLWNLHYLFHNKSQKRICYLYLRALNPAFKEDRDAEELGVYDMDMDEYEEEEDEGGADSGSQKRASYWLGTRYTNGGYARGSRAAEERNGVDIDEIRALLDYRKNHPEEFPEELSEDDTDRGGSVSPTAGSVSGNESDFPIADKQNKGAFDARKGSDVQAMSPPALLSRGKAK